MRLSGEVFQKFRRARGLKLKDLTTTGLSTSQLSRFEHGKTDLTVTKFMLALDILKIPLDEFTYTMHDFQQDELSELLVQVERFSLSKNIAGLKRLLIATLEESEHTKFGQLKVILLKIKMQEMTGETCYEKKDIDYLTEYLFSVEEWGRYELLFFVNTIEVLNHQSLMVLTREMVRRSDLYKELPENRQLLSKMLLKGYLTCIKRNKLSDAVYFEKQLKNLEFTETEIYERLFFHYCKNLACYRATKSYKALLELRKCIAMLRLVASDHLADTYEQDLEQIL